MLRDTCLDSLIDAFEAGFTDAGNRSGTTMSCPYGAADEIRRLAWQDGVFYNTAARRSAPPSRESIAPIAAYGVFMPPSRTDHPFVRTSVSFGAHRK